MTLFRRFQSVTEHKKQFGIAAVAVALLLSLTAYQAYAAVSDTVLAKHVINNTTTTSGMTVDLFDYSTSDSGESMAEDDGSNYAVANDFYSGINANQTLKFSTGAGASGTINVGSINTYTDSASPRWNIVSKTLGSDGYPYLNYDLTSSSDSLAYLFDPSIEVTGKYSYSNVTGLIQQDENGYYYYDSTKNFAEYDEDTNSFILYDEPAVTGGGGSLGQFFPFNKGAEVFQESSDGSITSYASAQSPKFSPTDVTMNHYFGAHISSSFVQPSGGIASSGDDMIFEFSGDDDIWIFIGGVLVGDLGGIHDKASITINFRTGSVVINDGDTTNGKTTTLAALYAEASSTSTTTWNGSTYAAGTYHTLDFYYLERGNSASNMYLRTNLAQPTASSIVKVDQSGDPVESAQMTLYAADENYTIDTSKGNAGVIATGTTAADGSLLLLDSNNEVISFDELAAESGENITHFVLRETYTPPGYQSSKDGYLYYEYGVLNSANMYESGVFASPAEQISVGGSETLTVWDGDSDSTNDQTIEGTSTTSGTGTASGTRLSWTQTSSSWWSNTYTVSVSSTFEVAEGVSASDITIGLTDYSPQSYGEPSSSVSVSGTTATVTWIFTYTGRNQPSRISPSITYTYSYETTGALTVEQACGDNSSGNIYAIIMMRTTGIGEHDPSPTSDEWYAVYPWGTGATGWSLSSAISNYGSSMSGMAQLDDTYKVPLTYDATTGYYTVDLEEIPGTVQEYYRYLQQHGDSKDAKYTIQFFYEDANENVTLLNTDDWQPSWSTVLYVSDFENRLVVQKTDEDGNGVAGATFAMFTADEMAALTGSSTDDNITLDWDNITVSQNSSGAYVLSEATSQASTDEASAVAASATATSVQSVTTQETLTMAEVDATDESDSVEVLEDPMT